jgi:preprotein translocase subunit SecA
MDDAERKKNYNCDVIYGTNNEFGFDYLRDNMKYDINEMVQRDHFFCIVDEVDSILIDEARTPLVISGSTEDKSDQYFVCNKFIKELDKIDYEIDEKDKNVMLSEKGIDKIEKLSKNFGILKNNNFYDPQNINLVHHINQALKANLLFSKDTDYIVRESKIQIIDEFTGRVLEGRRFADGLHQALEAKEKVQIQSENQTLASITYQNYFRLYKKLSGMTGTALTEAEEFYDIYKLKTISVPTNKSMIRSDLNDQIYRTEDEKYKAIIEKIIECKKKNQPVLVGTTSIEKSEKISQLLNNKNINHSVLNAKQHEKEASIITDAGKLGSITIATNMAGRGTDIQLGGNLNYLIKDNVKNQKEKILNEKKDVIKNGGLFVIGTERHESRRIDNQLRGRSGRQGDPGKSIFYISLEDDLMRIFGSESIDAIMQKFGLKEGESIDHPWINKALERAQKRVEGRNFDIRKTLLKFDDVMNDQRQVIFEQRKKILTSKNVNGIIDSFQKDMIKDFLNEKIIYTNENQLDAFKAKIKPIFGRSFNDQEFENVIKLKNDEFEKFVKDKFNKFRNKRNEAITEPANTNLEKRIFLQTVDFLWRSHLQYLSDLRQVVGLRSYGQKDPLEEFKREAFSLFEGLLNKIKIDFITFLNNLEVVQQEEVANESINQEKKPIDNPNCLLRIKKNVKFSRNEKCPATGKKYKNCCGAL